MRAGFGRLAAVLLLAAAVMAAAAPAQARWLRAESPRFIVYSDGDERTLRDQVQRLETFDRLLRGLHGLPMDGVPPRKLPIYLVGSQDELRDIYPAAPEGTAGFYAGASEEIFAVALRVRRQDYVLWHEYTHHFMAQHFPHPYPTWVFEGYAEYFMTTEIDERHVTYGAPSQGRGSWLLNARWLPIEEFLTRPRWEYADREDSQLYYAQAWLLTHWFMSDPERRARFVAYMTEVGQGGDPAEAMVRAAGMPLAALERTLRTYVRGGLAYARLDAAQFPPVEVTVTRLAVPTDDLVRLNQRVKMGVAEDLRDDTVAAVRRAAARHPDDPFALLVLGHAELHMGDRAAGEALLERLVEMQPDHVEALQLLASARMAEAEELEGAERAQRLNEANRLLLRALEADPDHYNTYFMLARNRSHAPDYPTEADMDLWFAAYELAPQLPGIRLGAGRALMLAGRFDEAETVLGVLANDPHRRETAAAAAALLELARQGLPPPPEPEANAGEEAEDG